MTSTERVRAYRERQKANPKPKPEPLEEQPVFPEAKKKLEMLGYRQVIAWARPEQDHPFPLPADPDDSDHEALQSFVPVVSYLPAECLSCRNECGWLDAAAVGKWLWNIVIERIYNSNTEACVWECLKQLIVHIWPEPPLVEKE